MSEKNKEQHPLLGEEESSDEECGLNAENQRRYRPLVYKGRARTAAKGASVIVTRWPEHWTSLVGFWWLAVSMFAISTFIVYRTMIAFAIIPRANGYPFYPYDDSNSIENSRGLTLPNVYMHVFVDNMDEVNLLDFFPPVKAFAANYSTFRFKFIIVVKDVKTDPYSLSAEEHNTIALNSLWNNKRVKRRAIADKDNIQIEQTTLTKCMDVSPLRKNWRRLPPQFVEFLVRAVAIWEKGGIAINPDIFTPRTPNPRYLDKLKDILNFYGKSNLTQYHLPAMNENVNVKKQNKNKTKKVNNIRDIIDILENDNTLSSQDTLVGAEDTENAVVVTSKRKLLSISLQNVEKDVDVEITSFENKEKTDYPKTNDLKVTNVDTNNNSNTLQISIPQKLNPETKPKASSLRMLPLFLEFIFKDKVQFQEPKVNATRHRKSIIPLNTTPILTDKKNEINSNTKADYESTGPKYKPMIISAAGMSLDVDKHDNSTGASVNIGKYEKYRLTIDLTGNILATETPCHAFLGTVFSNVMQHTQVESLKDFIIAELSLFCKGLLSSCRGIDLVLL